MKQLKPGFNLGNKYFSVMFISEAHVICVTLTMCTRSTWGEMCIVYSWWDHEYGKEEFMDSSAMWMLIYLAVVSCIIRLFSLVMVHNAVWYALPVANTYWYCRHELYSLCQGNNEPRFYDGLSMFINAAVLYTIMISGYQGITHNGRSNWFSPRLMGSK
jgi:hypothetical protein